MSKARSHSTVPEHEKKHGEEGEMIVHFHVPPVCTKEWHNPACPGGYQTLISCTLEEPQQCLCRHRL